MTNTNSGWSMFPASTDEYQNGPREGWTTSTPFDRCLRLLSQEINGRSGEKAERAIEEYVATLHDDARGAALDEMVRRRQTGQCPIGPDLPSYQRH